MDVQRIEGIHGASTVLVDPKDNSNRIHAPGVEFSISNNLFLTMDPDSFDQVLLFGDALISENAMDVVYLLQDMKKELYFAPGSYFQSIEDEVLDALLDLKPVMILEDRDLLLENFEYLEQMISGLQSDSKNTILFLAQQQALYGFDLSHKYLLENQEYEDAEYICVGYCLAKMANIDNRNSLLFAQEMGLSARHHLVLTDQQIDLFKERLKGMILHAS